jgi:hypothetical protein
MSLQINLGDGSIAAPDVLSIAVNAGDSIVITNVSGSTLNYYKGDTDAPVAGTIAASSNQTFTAPVWLESQGITTVLLQGGEYGP